MLSSRDAVLQQRILLICQAGNMTQSEGLQLSLYDTGAQWDLLKESHRRLRPHDSLA